MSRPSLDTLFAEAVSRSEGSERDTWIREACVGDTLLEHELRELLAASDSAAD